MTPFEEIADFDPWTSDFCRRYPRATVEIATMGDAEALAPSLRQSDIDELRFYEGKSGLEVLKESVANSKLCFSVRRPGGDITAMFGVGWTPNPRVGRVWFLSSAHVYEIGRLFLRECPAYIDLLMYGHDVIFNHVHDHNTSSVKWLRWLGFEQTAHFPEFGVHKQPFTEFCRFASPAIRDLYLHRDWKRFVVNCD